MMHLTTERLRNLYKSWSGKEPDGLEKIPGSGSGRQYFRIRGEKDTVIGAYNPDERENEAFLSFTECLCKEQLPVPGILAVNRIDHCYLLTDLGDTSLFSRLAEARKGIGDFPDEIVGLYIKALDLLPFFQVKAGRNINYTKCYPRPAFDRQSMLWDLNYFKYYFLKLVKASFDEQRLEDDFAALTNFLLSANSGFFMYRDFQSRNVMIVDDTPWFIDYQGGRKGALQYDVASLLYDAKADIPQSLREILLDHYLQSLNRMTPVNPEEFTGHYYGFVLIRILQALGAYGFRGYYENKPHFLQSIPFALKNLQFLIESGKIPLKLPSLITSLEEVIARFKFSSGVQNKSNLTVVIVSFSYKSSIPADESGNGGGYVFDCRALPNPGRYDEYKPLTGRDKPVIDFLNKEAEVDEFINHSFSLVDQSVRNYIDRGFTSLQVNFGCTGGRHRSVFCAEMLAKYLKERHAINVKVKHTEI